MESETKPNKAQYENGQKESFDPAKIALTNHCGKSYSGIEDYELKASITDGA
jgi:hypothetical protein